MADMEYRDGALCLDKINISNQETYRTNNEEFVFASIDSSGKIFEATNKNGDKIIGGNLLVNGLDLLSKDSVLGDKLIDKIKEETEKSPIEDNIVFPRKIYTITINNANVYGVIHRIFPEGLVKTTSMKNVKINGADNSIILSTSQRYVLSADDYVSKTYQIGVISNDLLSAQNQNIRVMCIGDSLTDGGYSAICEAFFKHYDYHLGNFNFISIGTRIENQTVEIGNESYTVRGCNEGESGIALSDYLRHAILVRAKMNDITRSYLTGKAAWDSLGLATKTRNGVSHREERIDYDGYTEERGLEMKNTCHGYYDVDPSEDLWTWIVKTKNVKSFTYEGTVYTFHDEYTSDDDELQKKYILYKCKERPDIRFYDYNIVQQSDGARAFDIGVYLDNYKTIDSSGNRLEHPGSRVYNVDAYDVCEPTHVVIIMTVNDGNNVSYGDSVAEDAAYMASVIKEYNPNINVAIASTRNYGVLNQSDYSDIGSLSSFYINKLCLDTHVKLLELDQTDNNFDYLPLYAVQSPRSGSYKYIDTLTSDIKQLYADTLHAGSLMQYLDRAYLVNSWVVYTFNQ